MQRAPFIFFLFCIIDLRAASASEHPGNVFVVGEDVSASVPAEWTSWRAIDVDGKEDGSGRVVNGKAKLGKLPVGYYELREGEGGPRVTAGVVAKNEPVEDTPIAI